MTATARGSPPSGGEVIDEMQRLGMVVDISHVSDPLFWDVIRYVKRPVIASHSSARALANVPRNMTDAMLKAVAQNGGAVCVNYNPGSSMTTSPRPSRRSAAQREAPGCRRGRPGATVREEVAPAAAGAALAAHRSHRSRRQGGRRRSRLPGQRLRRHPGRRPRGWRTSSKLPAITAELRERGYSRRRTSRRSSAATPCGCSRRTSRASADGPLDYCGPAPALPPDTPPAHSPDCTAPASRPGSRAK